MYDAHRLGSISVNLVFCRKSAFCFATSQWHVGLALNHTAAHYESIRTVFEIVVSNPWD